MKIALWNVNGAASKEEEINAMMRGTNYECKLRNYDGNLVPSRPDIELSMKSAIHRRPASAGSTCRRSGNIPTPEYAKIVRRYMQDEVNARWVRIPNIVDIVAVYVRPGAEREAFGCFMEDVRRRARCPFVMA